MREKGTLEGFERGGGVVEGEIGRWVAMEKRK